MAKGDHKRVENQVNTQVGRSQDGMNLINQRLGPQYEGFDAFNRGAQFQQGEDYTSIMQNYQNFINGNGGISGSGGSGGGVGGLHRQGEINSALAGYGQFAKDGGFSNQNIQDIRARNVAPTRAVYSNMQNEMARQKSLQGGYSPNFMAASAKMARQGAHAIGDMNVNSNASIAQMVQQGRLAGLGGLSSTALADQAQGLQRGIANASNATQNRGMNLQALGGMTNLFGQTPGMAQLYGNQTLGSMGQMLQGQGLQNQIGQMGINGSLGMAQVPGNFQAAMGNIGSALNLGGQVAGAITGLGGLGIPGMGGGGGILPTGASNPYAGMQQSPIGQVSFPSMPNFGYNPMQPVGGGGLTAGNFGYGGVRF